jgi:hypothetical protein
LNQTHRGALPVMAKPHAHEEKADLTGKDKSQDDLVDGGAQETPEGLKREGKGPLDKNVGRKQET